MAQGAHSFITRRSLVAAAAASAVAAPALPTPAVGAADPVFAAIAAHRAAQAAFAAAARHLCDVEEGLVDDMQDRGSGPDDDPVLIAAEATFDAACVAESRTAWVLARIKPSDCAVAAALLRYAAEVEADGEDWPDAPDAEDGRTWTATFHRHLAAALDMIAA